MLVVVRKGHAHRDVRRQAFCAGNARCIDNKAKRAIVGRHHADVPPDTLVAHRRCGNVCVVRKKIVVLRLCRDAHTTTNHRRRPMNLFFLDTNVDAAARAHVDRHCVKMILETAQLLSTAVRTLDPRDADDDDASALRPYRATHRAHPWAVWVRCCEANYRFACAFGAALCREYTHRYGKIHRSTPLLAWLASDARRPAAERFERPDAPLLAYGEHRLSELPQCMPDVYRRSGDPVGAYRAYYCGVEKRHLHAWRARERPAWVRCADDEGDAVKERLARKRSAPV